MGCGGSRLGGNAGGDEVPARIRPLLRRRLEEMKKRSQASVLKGNDTLSKKELLKHSSDGEETEHDGSRRSSAKVAPAPNKEEEEEEVNKEVVYEEESSERVIQVVKEREDNDEDDDHEEEEEEEEERMSNFDERMLCPGSPSFRVYCIHLSDDESDQESDGEKNTKPELENCTIVVDPTESIKPEKKGRKGRRFGIALSRATPRKYLFNVTAPCYNVAAGGCMGNNHSRLVQEKSTK